MSKTGIFTFALCKQRSIVNYHDANELEMLFPGKEPHEVQKLVDKDMEQYLALTNMLRVGDTIKVEPEHLNYRFLNSDDEPISCDTMHVVDIQSSVTIFKNNIDQGGSDIHLKNVDSVVPMKKYASMNLSKLIEKDPTFTVSGNVRSTLNIVVKPVGSNCRYVFTLKPGLNVNILRRLKVGDMVNGKTITKMTNNYTMVDSDQHWKYIRANICEFRGGVTNTHRINYIADNEILSEDDLTRMCITCMDDSIKHKTCLCDTDGRTILRV